MKPWLDDFRQTIEAAHPRLSSISESDSERSRAEGAWSTKQILGHLIDSAANNHVRFVLAQLKDDLIFSGYDQNGWVKVNGYQEASWRHLVDLWRAYNLHLHHLIAQADETKMETLCARHTLQEIAFKAVPPTEPATLEYLMQDYVAHLKHHLAQIFSSGEH